MSFSRGSKFNYCGVAYLKIELKILYLINKNKIMRTADLRLELHKIIDEVKDEQILQAIYLMLSSQVGIFAHTTEGKSLTKDEFDELLQASEEDIQYGRLTTQEKLKEEIKTWRKK